MRRRVLARLVFVSALVALWQAAWTAGLWSEVLLPPPGRVALWLGRSLADGTLAGATLVTLRRLVLGYAAGLALGLPLGMLTTRFRPFHETVGLLLLGVQSLPSVCWVPLAMLWFGQTETAMLFVVLMGTVGSIALAMDQGIRSVPPIYVRAARTMGSKGLHTWLRVIVPASLPLVLSGMKQGWAFAWRSLMAAEIFVTILTGLGLGHLLHYGRELHAMDQVIGVILVIVLVGVSFDRLIFAPAERALHRRWGTGRIE
ncbi:MAG: ABC transporter permease [Planctomycetes bacterium]|nr:ABC transporter permease [Planctomycetota bacterium]